MTSAAGVTAAVTPTTPLLVWHRFILAASDALVDLVAQGAVTPVAEVLGVEPNSEVTRSLTIPGTVSIAYQFDSHSARVSLRPPLPEFAPGYRLAPGLREYAQHWFLDPDLFVADLDVLALDLRTARAVQEAIRAFRVGLYLAAINLLGAASEGAWYAAGEALRHLDPNLAKALDEDRTTKVIALVAEVLRQDRAIASEVPGLVAQAELHRHLRNYGVHPRPDTDDFAERYLSESGTALLLIEDYAYLRRLSAALRSRLTVGNRIV